MLIDRRAGLGAPAFRNWPVRVRWWPGHWSSLETNHSKDPAIDF